MPFSTAIGGKLGQVIFYFFEICIDHLVTGHGEIKLVLNRKLPPCWQKVPYVEYWLGVWGGGHQHLNQLWTLWTIIMPSMARYTHGFNSDTNTGNQSFSEWIEGSLHRRKNMSGSGNHHQDDEKQPGECRLDRLVLVSRLAPTSSGCLGRPFLHLLFCTFVIWHTWGSHHLSYPSLCRMIVSRARRDLIYFGSVCVGPCCVVQAGLEFPGSRDSPISASGVGSTVDAYTQLGGSICSLLYIQASRRGCAEESLGKHLLPVVTLSDFNSLFQVSYLAHQEQYCAHLPKKI